MGQCHVHPPSLQVPPRPEASLGPALQKGSVKGRGWEMDWWQRGDVAPGRTRAGHDKLQMAGGISVLTRQFGSTSDDGGSQMGQEKSL